MSAEEVKDLHLNNDSIEPSAEPQTSQQSADTVALVSNNTATSEAPQPSRSQLKQDNPLYEGSILVGNGEINNLVTAERFRVLRAKIERSNLGQQSYRLLAVTSALPEEGKSLVSSNLARALSIDPLGKTLLIDCDLRRPSVHTFFNIPDRPGLADLVLNKVTSDEVIQHASNRLDVISTGTPVNDPTQIIERPELATILNEFRKHYQYIILDCPPTMLCSEPITISSIVDSMLLVVRAWTTPKRVVRDAINAIGSSRILGLVINDGLDASRMYVDYGYYTNRKHLIR